MHLKKAALGDLPQLAALFDGYRVFYGQQSALHQGHNFLHKRLQRGESEIFVTYTPEGLIGGFVQLYPIFSSTRMQRLWLLNDLFVHPDYRGRGISVLLIDQAKALCRNTQACGMLLETAKSNLIGNHLYPATGSS